MRKRSILMIAGIAILAVAAMAQESRSSIALAGTGLFTSESSGHDPFGSRVTRQTENTGGFLVTYRCRLWRWLAAEGDYGLAPNSMQFSTTSGPFSGDAYMHQATAGFIVNLPTRARFRFSPYLLAEGGALIFSPASGGFTTTGGFSSNPPASRQTKAAFIYGGGGDFAIAKHWSLPRNIAAWSITLPTSAFRRSPRERSATRRNPPSELPIASEIVSRKFHEAGDPASL